MNADDIKELDAFRAARKRVFDSFNHRGADGSCRCVYCRRDETSLEDFADLAANYELDKFAVELKLAAANTTIADLRAQLVAIVSRVASA